MNTLDPDFRVYMNCGANFDEILSWFRSHWLDLNIMWHSSGRSGQTEENWLEFERNKNSDQTRAVAEEDGWYYYPFILVVQFRRNMSPTISDIDKQSEFARLLKTRLEGIGCMVNIQAEFLVSL